MKHELENFKPMGEISRNNRKRKEINMKTNYQWTFTVNGIKRILSGLVLAAGVMLTQPVMAAAYPAPVNLNSCSNFMVLGATEISRVGSGLISGDVGLSPGVGSKITGFLAVDVDGTIYAVDTTGPAGSVEAPELLSTAKSDLTTAYLDAEGRSVDKITVAGNIGGQTLAPGLYWSDSTLQITGDLTLDAGGDPNAVWIFQMASTLTTEAGGDGDPHSRVILAGGAQARNIFWQVGSSATLGTYSIFKGTIMALASVTMNVGSTIEGRALARNAAVTFGGSSGSLPPLLSNQVITNFIPTNSSTFAGTDKVGLSAQASSGLTVSFAVKSGSSAIIGAITDGTNLAFAATGLVSIVASQAGNGSYNPAPSVTNTFTVVPPLPVEPGWLAIQVTPSSGTWRLTAPTGYTGPTSGTGNLAPVSAVVGAYTIAYGALSGYMLPTNHNQSQVVVVGVTSLFTGVYLQISTDITPPVVSATEGTYTNKVQISWDSVSGVTSYQIWKSQTNDINTAVLIVEVPDDGAATFLYDDDDVVPLRSYYYWGLSKTATQISAIGLVSMGYASLTPDPDAGSADITASDMVYLPVNVTNLTAAGTVSFRLGNLGPDPLNSSVVAFDFRISSSGTNMVLLGTDQRAFSLAAGQEQLVILTAQAKRGVVVPVTLKGVKQVQVTVRHASTALVDPNLANNKTTAAGDVLVRASGINSPGRAVNDYDGDGKSDGCLYQSTLGRWYAKLSGNRYSGDGVWFGDVGIGWMPAPGDYDGDGVTDIAAYYRSSGSWLALLSSNGQLINGYFGGQDYTAAQCDIDGDARTDPVVYRESDGYWSVAPSTRQYVPCGAFLGITGPQSVPADYDGDGLADPAIYNRETGLWCIACSSIGYQLMTGLFGENGLPVSADYDGDGLVDPATYQPATAEWQVLLSRSLATHGYYTWWGGSAGTADGIPVPADYDGDGLADPTVAHQDTGLWELFLSNQGYQPFRAFFCLPDYEPMRE